MFPIHDDNPTLGSPYVTYFLIALNAAVWVFVQGLGTQPALARSVCELGLIPGELLGTAAAGTEVQLSRNLSCVIDSSPSWITPFSSMFLHGGWFHLIGNMWFLFVFGNNVEDSMGSFRFVLFYLLCGLAAAAAQMISAPGSTVPMVGASGAIGGVMGAYAVTYPKVRVHMLIILGFFITRVAVPAYFMLGYWFIIQLLGTIPTLSGKSSGVAFWAHIGGFLAGIGLIYIFRNRKRIQKHDRMVFRY